MQMQAENKEAIKRKYPEAVVLVIVKDSKGKYNITPFSWAMTASRDPLMFAVSFALNRFTLEAVRKKGEFVIAFPSSLMAEEVLYYGTHSGRDVDKLADRPLDYKKAETVDSILIDKCAANFECILESEHIAGDHAIITARVLKSWVNDDKSLTRLFNTASGYKLQGIETGAEIDLF